MSLSTITSQYTGLNGLSNYGASCYGGTLYSDAYVDNAKTSIENGYEISATSNSYSNKSSVSSSSFAQQCQAIEYLLEQGRTDAAMEKYDDLYEDMASNSYYSGYTENEIKTLLQEKYLGATGTTIVSAIKENSDSAYAAGAKSSIPLIGIFSSNNCSDDFVAKATGTDVSGWSKVKTALGVTTGVAGSAAAGAGAAVLAAGARTAKNSGLSLSTLTNAVKTSGNTGIVAACVCGVAALGTYIIGKVAGSSN